MPSARACAAIDARLRWIAAPWKIEQKFPDAMWLPKTGGRCLLAREVCPWPMDLKFEQDSTPNASCRLQNWSLGRLGYTAVTFRHVILVEGEE